MNGRPHIRQASPLPSDLVARYRDWRATRYEEKRGRYAQLASEGQRPHAMVISCCDSRVTLPEMFGADPGEFFVHRNIASIVPPHDPGAQRHCTSAAVEYAVSVLQVPHVLVIGHSGCGGVQGCHDMCAGLAPALEAEGSMVGRWLDVLRPVYARTIDVDPALRLGAMERAGVLISLENLLSYRFVQAPVAAGRLRLHGLWTDIASGVLEEYDATSGTFVPL
ncbi:carbonic anhydrase [Rhodobaculum claviforme]|uniref:carbonic anhydrase n=1 Tax=Rhodobaculum claviforme TaxID=1549854 RepID=UPI003084599B